MLLKYQFVFVMPVQVFGAISNLQGFKWISLELMSNTNNCEHHSSMWIVSKHISSIVTWLENGNE